MHIAMLIWLNECFEFCENVASNLIWDTIRIRAFRIQMKSIKFHRIGFVSCIILRGAFGIWIRQWFVHRSTSILAISIHSQHFISIDTHQTPQSTQPIHIIHKWKFHCRNTPANIGLNTEHWTWFIWLRCESSLNNEPCQYTQQNHAIAKQKPHQALQLL